LAASGRTVDDRPDDERGPPPDEAGASHSIEIDGRRWRATDPSIPPALRQELVEELMRARRAIKLLRVVGDAGLLADAHRQAHAAKVALGERGDPWWERPTATGQRDRVEAAILALAGHRAPRGSICPSDAARAVGGTSWRRLVPAAREAARALAAAGDVTVTQGGRALDPTAEWRGPIRIRLGRR
jgi:hypothetical protein